MMVPALWIILLILLALMETTAKEVANKGSEKLLVHTITVGPSIQTLIQVNSVPVPVVPVGVHWFHLHTHVNGPAYLSSFRWRYICKYARCILFNVFLFLDLTTLLSSLVEWSRTRTVHFDATSKAEGDFRLKSWVFLQLLNLTTKQAIIISWLVYSLTSLMSLRAA